MPSLEFTPQQVCNPVGFVSQAEMTSSNPGVRLLFVDHNAPQVAKEHIRSHIVREAKRLKRHRGRKALSVRPSTPGTILHRGHKARQHASKREILALTKPPLLPIIDDAPQQKLLLSVSYAGAFILNVRFAQHLPNGPDIVDTIFCKDVTLGGHFLSEGALETGGALLERGCQSLAVLLQSDTNDAVGAIIYTFWVLNHKKLPDVALVISRFLYQLCLIMFGVSHSMTIFARYIRQNYNSIHALQQAIVFAYHDATAIAPRCKLSMERLNFILNTFLQDGHSSDCQHWYNKAIEDADHLPGGPDLSMKGKFLTRYSNFLRRRKGDYQAAYSVLQQAITILDKSGVSDAETAIRARLALINLIEVYPEPSSSNDLHSTTAVRDKILRIIDILKPAASRAIKELGVKHSVTINVVQTLGLNYRNLGAISEYEEMTNFVLLQLKDFRLT